MVMENGPPTIGFEDGTIDVERLLVEPQDGHVSVDSVMCFNEKIPDSAMRMDDVSRSFGVSNTGIAQQGEDILNRDVLDSMHNEVGYFRLQNDFCSMGEEYLLGVEFAESITNLDYGSSEALQTSVSDNPILASTAGIDTSWKEDLFRIMEVPKCQNNQLIVETSEFGEIPNRCPEAKPLKTPTSCTLRDIDKFQDISSCSFQDILSDENDTSLSPSVEMLCSPKNEKIDESVSTGQNETKRFHGEDALVTMSAQASSADAVPTQKRSRKPTQRYIDELADPILRLPKKKREGSSSTLKDKSQGVKDHKKFHTGSRAMKLPAEESSVKAIQVPFASLVHKECPKSPTHDMVRRSDRGHLLTKSKDNHVTPEHLKRDEFPAIHQKKRDHSERAANQKKKDDTCNPAYLKKTDDRLTAPSQKKRNDFIPAVSPKKRDDCLTAIRQKKRDEYFAEESPEEVLDSMHNEVGYFRLQNDFCSMGEEYLLGVEFAESITNLDYGSSEALQTSVSDNPILASTAGIDTSWKEDLFRIMEVPKCQNNQLIVETSEFGEIPNRCPEAKPLKTPTSCTLRDIDKFQDISSCSFQDILSDENDTSLSPSVEMLCSPKNEKIDESVSTGQNETKRFHGEDALVTMSAQASSADAVPTQKRSRKPTQRYIDELADPILRLPKKKREGSSSTLKDKSQGVKDHKKFHTGSRAMKLPAEESSVKAIQVPFASLVHKECPKSPTHDMVRRSDRGHLLTKSKDNHVTPEHLKRDEFPAIHQKKRDHSERAANQKKKDDTCNPAYLKKTDDRLTAPSQKKRNDFIPAVSPKKRDDCLTAIRQKKRDEYFAEESPEEVSGRRKHHRLWTIAEVRKLIDGVSEYGVGRWSRIKKLFFSASAHRTSVDLKDKWRNLLKASGIQGQGNRQGEKKRNLAWRPLPKSILRRVCELASMYPYPKGRKPKIPHINHDSPDRSTDITLSDYRRILRSINGN
ncbi:hypothetical protein CDL12_19570 [Handroanthus impetiginosus]|uniref:Uncharacterized protein n=1 Tax=Handroanthus impetiginosus TaxID=429701 RepID=A0A2G9GRF7_9LAMI|nr:hypothetical protein CDL12_19570 [Handroanthus impetiginosus]